MSAASADMMGAALRLAEAGCHVFPLRPGEKVPACEHGCKDATRDPARITAWWTAMPVANVGIAVGPSGLAVVDVDGIFGYGAWHKLIAEHPTPRTLTVSTPRGRHFYFRADPDRALRNTAGQLGQHVDTRGPGGYVVAPPSVVADRPYTWGTVPDTLPTVPGWVLDRLAPATRVPQLHAAPHFRPGGTSGYADAALSTEVQQVLDAAAGTRNVTLNVAAFNLGTLVGAGMLAETLAREALVAAGESAGLPTTECEGTVRSGLSAGIAQPRRVAS